MKDVLKRLKNKKADSSSSQKGQTIPSLRLVRRLTCNSAAAAVRPKKEATGYGARQ
jgi:hypothetical protein